MKKHILFFFLGLSQLMVSQVSFSKNKLIKDGKTYKKSEYKQVFQNKEALLYFEKYRTNYTVSQIIGGVGGLGIGIGLARAINGNKIKIVDQFGKTIYLEKKNNGWSIIGIGVGIVGLAVPFALSADKNLKKAIEKENGDKTAFIPYFKLENTGLGLALSYNF